MVLERIFRLCNDNFPPGYTGHSLSPSDVVETVWRIGRRYFYCDTNGFVPVQFSPMLAKKNPESGNAAASDDQNRAVGRNAGCLPRFGCRGGVPPGIRPFYRNGLGWLGPASRRGEGPLYSGSDLSKDRSIPRLVCYRFDPFSTLVYAVCEQIYAQRDADSAIVPACIPFCHHFYWRY